MNRPSPWRKPSLAAQVLLLLALPTRALATDRPLFTLEELVQKAEGVAEIEVVFKQGDQVQVSLIRWLLDPGPQPGAPAARLPAANGALPGRATLARWDRTWKRRLHALRSVVVGRPELASRFQAWFQTARQVWKEAARRGGYQAVILLTRHPGSGQLQPAPGEQQLWVHHLGLHPGHARWRRRLMRLLALKRRGLPLPAGECWSPVSSGMAPR